MCSKEKETEVCCINRISVKRCDATIEDLCVACSDCILITEKKIQLLKMNYEKFRIESFIGWSVPWIDAKLLAKIGFYYSGIGDRVICNFCKLGLWKWGANDCPLKNFRNSAPGRW